ncbi:MAG: ATPase [Deltaproteobacteria bacterium SM23_61]|nr:MAG: ATPase [Deltaproteobacteria bacterium SM23_61]
MNCYQLDDREILQIFDTSESGLTEEEAGQRLRRYGPNRLAEEEKISRVKVFLHQFASPLIYILLLAAVVTLLLREYVDAGVILSVLILNAVIGYLQEFKAEESVRALTKMIIPQARVWREGREKEIPSEELVPGDVVILASGSKVPADIRLLSEIDLKIDESMLTGESVPVDKDPAPLKVENLSPGDQLNMAFMGTIVVSGRGRGIVVATGGQTSLGGIAREVREAQVATTPLQEKFHRFSNRIGLVVLGAAVILVVIGVLIGEPLKDMFMTAVAAAVATIPEGLPVVLTIALAAGIRRMARKNAIIRQLPAVETLGSTTVICTDKTGTLTQNEMTVKVVFDGEHVFNLTGTGYSPEGEILHEWVPASEKERKQLFMALRIGLLCNESTLYRDNGEYRVNGDPTEGALIAAAMKGGLRPEGEREEYRQIGLLPFESDYGYMATLHLQGGKKWIFVKGGLEKMLDLCTSCLATEEIRIQEILETSNRFAREGMRVLAMAYKEAPADLELLRHQEVEGNLILAGIQGMIDPPRPEVKEAIQGSRQAGIRVVMITGDHPATAVAVGKTLGIFHDESEVLTGKDVEGMSDEDLFARVSSVSVYARVAPHHKLRIVQQLIKQGEVVAVTGDGVNDAPALKAAHIGVAMGRKGTDVAKEASDMVVTDDNFAAIFNAVEEGRVVFDNIRKVIFFLIPTGVAAIGSIIGSILLGVPIPYTPSQLLWINLVTNGLQVLALTFEPGEKNVISRPPRDPREGIMSRVLIERTVIVGLLISAGVVYNFVSELRAGDTLEKARTMAVTTMVFFQFFQSWNSRSEAESIFRLSPFSNPFLLYGLLASILAHLASIYFLPFQWVLRTEPLSLAEWSKIAVMSLTVILVVEIDKAIRKKGNLSRTGPPR